MLSGSIAQAVPRCFKSEPSLWFYAKPGNSLNVVTALDWMSQVSNSFTLISAPSQVDLINFCLGQHEIQNCGVKTGIASKNWQMFVIWKYNSLTAPKNISKNICLCLRHKDVERPFGYINQPKNDKWSKSWHELCFVPWNYKMRWTSVCDVHTLIEKYICGYFVTLWALLCHI